MVETAFGKKPYEVELPKGRPSEYYAMYVFNREKMFKYLSAEVYAKLINVIDTGSVLDRSIADEVAAGMKKWAVEMGVTHYTHWFAPLTEGTAEKHDSFIEHDGKGGVIEEFTGKLLVQQEPDASSFPNGGIRNTFEARGYSAWDPSSPAFIVDDTLCIPTIFIAYTGESLDYKAPLLKALRAVDKAATDVCRYFNPDVKKVYAYLGWEQEYFLVDEGLYAARPDLLLTGRTLMGHDSAKNQQLEDHYFGAIPTRVAAFMKELEIEALKLGIPVKTRHNEVAPNQFELAPVYEECNLANDHNMLIMSLMRKLARNHGFRVLLHEKPFKGVNGSGKHNNWSLGTDTGIALMAPGKDFKSNLRFVTFVVNTLMAVYRHNGLLKASIASANNAHRLGANEAPPAIISSFLGSQLSAVLKHISESEPENLQSLGGKKGMNLGIPAFQISLRSRFKAMDSDMDLSIGQLGQSIHTGLEVFLLFPYHHIQVRSQWRRIESRYENVTGTLPGNRSQIIRSLPDKSPKPCLQQLLLNLLGRCRNRIQDPELFVFDLFICLDPDFLDDPARPDDNLADPSAHRRSQDNPRIVFVIEQNIPGTDPILHLYRQLGMHPVKIHRFQGITSIGYRGRIKRTVRASFYLDVHGAFF